MNKLSVKL